ncbi:MAG: peroxiredoxin [Oceanospirillaceae bacterium]
MINIGDNIPEATLKIMSENGPKSFETAVEFKDKKVVLFAVPGAFTPTCSAAHLPGFVVHYDKFIEAGVDTVACVSVNDAFVMNAWGLSANAENIAMLGDGNATFAKALGLELDASKFHMGIRSKRFALVIDNGIVTYLAVDESGLDKTSAEEVLKNL